MATKSAHWFRQHFGDKSRAAAFTATDDFTTLGLSFIPVKNANYQIFIQKIIVNVGVPGAVTLTFQDSAGTPVVIGALTTSAPRGSHLVLDGGADGIPLTVGKNLDSVASAAG